MECGVIEMKKYVVGFVFDKTYEKVLLIKKNRPEWQKGKINGLGGKIEEGETSIEAMRREFLEECGLDVPIEDWFCFCEYNIIIPESACIYFYTATVDDIHEAKSTTDEIINVCFPDMLPGNVIPNLKWLIPMASAEYPVKCLAHEVAER